jgi:hypothetical protein
MHALCEARLFCPCSSRFESCTVVLINDDFVLKTDAVVNVIADSKPDLSKASQVSAAIFKAAGAELQQVVHNQKANQVLWLPAENFYIKYQREKSS